MAEALLTPFAVARASKGLSLAQVSKAVKYDRGGLSRIERGRAKPRRPLAKKLSLLLCITPEEIMFPEEFVGKGAKKPVRSSQEAR